MSNNQYQQSYPQQSENSNSSLLTQQPNFQQQQQQFYQQQPEQVYQQQSFTQQPVNPMSGSSTSWARPAISEPLIVLLCNLFMPGLGHILLGQTTKGIVIMISWFILYTVIVVLASLVIGIFLIPLIVVHIGIILYDGQVLADRVKRNYPIMVNENSTSWMKLITFGGFNHNNIDECPQEWISVQNQINQTRHQQQQQ